MKKEISRRSFLKGTAAAAAAGMILPKLPIWAEEESASGACLMNLKVEGKTAPLGVDTDMPAFSWQMKSDRVGAAQESYQIMVKKAADNSLVWDSGVQDGGASVAVPYEGDALEPATAYLWQVKVTDELGEELISEEASFETSLLDHTLEAWNGAKWIGTSALNLVASHSTTFDITTGIQIPEGSTTASVIFGANDFRYSNKLYNLVSLEGENYIRAEIDISGIGTEEGAAVKFYRVGYYPGDTADTPIAILNQASYPEININELLTETNKHEMHRYEFEVNTSTVTVYIDGQMVVIGMAFSFTGPHPTGGIVLSPWGALDAMTFPNLNSIGFAARAGQKAIFTDYQLNNPQYGTGVLFGENVGATYAIWDGANGLTVEGNTLTVGGEEEVLFFADPSFGGEPYLRSTFSLEGEPVSARLYVSFQGDGHIYLNGQEVAPDEWFKQGSMEYREEIGYHVYDVSGMLTAGDNAIGAVLGEGWWCGHIPNWDETYYNYFGDTEALLVKLVVTYADGNTQTIVSNPETWESTSNGPLRIASMFEGTVYDATKDAFVEGYSTASFDASAWESAVEIPTRPAFANQQLVVRHDEDVHAIATLPCIGVQENGEGSGLFIYDLSENRAAVLKITIPADLAKEGETLTIRIAETLYPEMEEYGELAGNLLVENYRAALNTFFYTMKAGEQTFFPDLAFTGFRYVEIAGLDEALPLQNIESVCISSVDMTSTYESSNELANRLFVNGQNTAASNYITMPTDCPQRNERMGWTGDANAYALAGSYNGNTYNFMRQWLQCVREEQDASGMTTGTAPSFPAYNPFTGEVYKFGVSFGVLWNSISIFMAYYQYNQYGDPAIVKENLDSMYAYLENLKSKPFTYTRGGAEYQEEGLTNETGFSMDHLALSTTSVAYLANAMYVRALCLVAEMAEKMGDTENAAKYAARYEEGKAAFNRVFIDVETGKSCDADGTIIDNQASYACPLGYGIVSDENLERFLAHYVASIENPKTDDGSVLVPYAITTGFCATPNVLNALTNYGRGDIAYQMFENTEYSSWLYSVTQGATSIWERWDSYTVEGGYNGHNSMNSFNHYSIGSVTSWMMDTQLGIQYDTEVPGYQHMILQPVSGGAFTFAKGSFESSYGTIVSGWEAKDGAMTVYEATIPANTGATLYLPIEEAAANAMKVPEGASFLGMTEHNGVLCAQYELVSGSYHFVW